MPKGRKPSTIIEHRESKTWLLLIGIGEYEDDNLDRLQYAINDCQNLADTFKKINPQAEIILHCQESKNLPILNNIRNSFQQLLTEVKTDDTIIVYFSGHGVLSEVKGRVFLCIADTQTNNLSATGLGIKELLDFFNNCAARKQLAILDACHSGDLSLRNSPTSKLIEDLQEQAKKRSFYALLSCDREQRSWEFPALLKEC
jgi:uncharacterized caspase-like protein